ncbi:MAG: TetR family transcriptional regulator [Myxococcota bacterium]
MSDDATPRGRGRPRTIDRDQAVLTAMQTWWTEGVESVSVNAISRRTGLSKSSLYREFGGEDGLMAAALERYRDLAVRPLLGLLRRPGGESRPADVEGTLALVVHGTTEPRGMPPGCFFTKLRLTETRLGKQTAGRVRSILDERNAAFESWYAEILAHGQGNPALSAEEGARYLDAQLTLLLVRVAAGDPVDAVRIDAMRALSVLWTRSAGAS